MNSSVSTLISSLALYQLWCPRIVGLEGASSAVVSAMIDDGMRQMQAIEPTVEPNGNRPDYWTKAIRHLGRLL